MKTAVECININKKFGETTALNNFNFKLDKNKLYGLLGRNGAGKTTLLDIITAHKFQDSGEVKIFGENNFENHSVQEKTCHIKEESKFVESFLVKNLFKTASSFYPKWDQNLALKLIKRFDIKQTKQYRKLSKGMKSAVNIVIGLSSRAPLTIFDESYMGLDTPSRQLFYDLLLEDFRQYPRTIILSTHLIDEINKIFDEVIIIDKGSLLLQEEADTIRAKSYSLVGKKEVLQDKSEQFEVINKQQQGQFLQLDIFQKLSDKKISELNEQDIEVENLTLARVFSYLTSLKKEDQANGK